MLSEAGSAQWTLLPGSRGAELCAFINKPSLITSNAFLVRTPFEIIVIDPGASVEQKDKINRVLVDVLREHPRPVFVLLTHCHHDHSCHAGDIGAEGAVIKRIAHAATIDALRRRDAALTVAELYPNAKICDARFDLGLFGNDEAPACARSIALGQGVQLRLRRDAAVGRDGARVERQGMQLAPGTSWSSIIRQATHRIMWSCAWAAICWWATCRSPPILASPASPDGAQPPSSDRSRA